MRLHHVLLSWLAVFALAAQAQTAPLREPAPKVSALDGALFYQILLGELNARSEEPGTAFSILLDAARKTSDPALFKRSVQIALQARSGESALVAARAWSKALPSSQEANRYVLQILLGLNRLADTLAPLKKELSLTPAPQRRELIWALPGLYDRVRDKQAAVALVEQALADAIKLPDLSATVWASLGRMRQAAGDSPAALNAAKQGLSQDPRSEHAALLALSLIDPGRPEAETLVKSHLAAARPEFRMAYVKTLLNGRREDDAKLQLQTLREQTPDYADAWLVEGALLAQQGQSDLAEQHLSRYLDLTNAQGDAKTGAEVRRGRSQAFLTMAQVFEQRQDLTRAQEWLQKVDNPDDIMRAQIRSAALMAKQGRVDEAISLIRNQAERSSTDARLKRSAEVQLLRDQKLFERAREALKNYVAQFPDDSDLVYDLAMVYEKLGDLAEMERLLRELIAARPDDPHAYNALGYSLADRNLRLPEAIELITKALQLTPKDPFITDSLAWAFFRSGNNEEALRLLQQAYSDRPDAEIAAHLGEVLWQMGQHASAQEIFRQGLKLSPENETLKETVKRLRVPL
ncbi:MAG: tetratricopeptide repeat protein [Rhodoferax sp.]|nr:tetratricopeptide repeat protein [Rhodoferax sp.]OIP19753.1 MAG: hypothetical protein AUK52_11920 [Comamonadaceae bacterium CG2_30_60_41]PIW07360.1 MAG: hypothetical protein COW39_13635 [Comamonadaceae bacterium CG17_big_fil_post_rev_8_21_14_2_50_60_13]PIY26331.1 MAG: hypothetical protein COZ10_02755 [Comamonadaceae bacterium CG_4_10_14_3_um_filter_60_75]PJC12555.1 MAG: hypothetical protein CO066_09705 [Comamonadaceae bacterium CG_4_9_14_0_8_um_filter_60_18]